MTRRTGSIVAVLCAAATLGGPAAAHDTWDGVFIFERPAERAMAGDGHAPTPAQQLALLISTGSTLDRFLSQLPIVFLHADVDGDGVLTEADASLHRAAVTAASVTSEVTQIMFADFDGDGFVTAAELRQKLKFQLQRARTLGGPLPPPVPGGPDDPDQRIAQEIARLMAADTDRDGRISWAEAAAFVRSQTDPARLFTTASVSQWPITFLRALVPGKDRVALADVEAAAEAVFREIDADHDGTVSAEERDGWIRRQAAHPTRLEPEKQRGR